MGDEFKKIFAPFISIFALVVFCLLCGVFEKIGNEIASFLVWYIQFNYFGIGLNDFFSLVVKILIWPISFGLVGVIFNSIGLFNKKAMRIAYAFISFIVTVALTYLFKFLQDYLWWIVGVIAIVIVISILSIVLCKKFRKKGGQENE